MSSLEDTYKTVGSYCQGIFRDKGSKFIAHVFPFQNEVDLKDIIIELKDQHPKARHFCWAYRLTPDRNVYRVNDDGEPSGTAGKPILNILLSSDITNTLVVVVRYFGGTLLGVPGLINAYKLASLDAIQQADIIECTVNDVYQVDFDYVQMNDIMRIVKENDIKIVSQSFDTNCIIKLEIRKLQVDEVLGRLKKILGVRLNYIQTK